MSADGEWGRRIGCSPTRSLAASRCSSPTSDAATSSPSASPTLLAELEAAWAGRLRAAPVRRLTRRGKPDARPSRCGDPHAGCRRHARAALPRWRRAASARWPRGRWWFGGCTCRPSRRGCGRARAPVRRVGAAPANFAPRRGGRRGRPRCIPCTPNAPRPWMGSRSGALHGGRGPRRLFPPAPGRRRRGGAAAQAVVACACARPPRPMATRAC